MPIVYRVDHEHRVVIARGHGTFTDTDVFDYQRGVWSSPDVAGYDELIDMTHVVDIPMASTQRIQDLASAAAHMDSSSPSRLAIVAPGDVAYGLGRMFQAYREFERKSVKEVGVFRTLDEAWSFLKRTDAPALPPVPPRDTPEPA
jgi:hypothetical protein